MTGPSKNRRSTWLAVVGAFLLLFICVLYFNANIDVSKLPAYEASAVGQLRNIALEQEKFRESHNGCFASQLGQLPNITSERYHYTYELKSVSTNDGPCIDRYVVTASPLIIEKTSSRYFFMDERGTIRSEISHPANASSPILQ